MLQFLLALTELTFQVGICLLPLILWRLAYDFGRFLKSLFFLFYSLISDVLRALVTSWGIYISKTWGDLDLQGTERV